MKEKEIERTIQKDYHEFYSKLYEGEIPPGIIGYFKKALFALAPNVHQIKSVRMQDLIGREQSTLSTLEVGVVINTILSVPFDRLHDNLDDAIAYHSKLEEVKDNYNMVVAKIDDTLKRKRATLNNLSGTNDGKAMRIIAQA